MFFAGQSAGMGIETLKVIVLILKCLLIICFYVRYLEFVLEFKITPSNPHFFCLITRLLEIKSRKIFSASKTWNVYQVNTGYAVAQMQSFSSLSPQISGSISLFDKSHMILLGIFKRYFFQFIKRQEKRTLQNQWNVSQGVKL